MCRLSKRTWAAGDKVLLVHKQAGDLVGVVRERVGDRLRVDVPGLPRPFLIPPRYVSEAA